MVALVVSSFRRHPVFLRAILQIHLYRFLTSMKPNPFIENLILLLALLAGLNYWILLWHKPQRLEFINRLETSEPIDTLVLGDSTIATGLDRTTYKDAWKGRSGSVPGVHNAGIGNSTAIAHLLALRKAVRHHPEIKRVIYGAIGFRLTDREFGPTESVAKNVFLEYYQEPKVAAAFHGELRPFGELIFGLERRIPMFVERQSFWIKIERLRRRFDRLGMPSRISNAFGRRENFENFLHPDFDAFVAHCNQTVDDRSGLWGPIDEMIRVSHENEVELTVVFMPMSKRQRERFYDTQHWRRYFAHVSRVLAKRNVKLIDATDWVSLPDKEAFPDNLHLTGEASLIFSKRLAEIVHDQAPPLAGRQ